MMMLMMIYMSCHCCRSSKLLLLPTSRARLLSEYEIAATTDPEPIVRDFFFGERERWW